MNPADLEMVRLAAASFRTEPAREREIHDRYGNVTRYWIQVNHLIEHAEVMAALPVQCRMLRERRARGQRSRSA